MAEDDRSAPTRYVDLAAYTRPELLELIGELTVMFGRLEYMVLLALKRKSGLSLARAQKLYKHYSLGAKVFGKKPCAQPGSSCRDFDSPPGLRSYSSDVEGLAELCGEIQELTKERNKIIHGLVATVAEEEYVIHNTKVYELRERALWDLKDRVIDAILRLNELIPIPGLNACWVTGPGLDIDYDRSAFDSDDLIVPLCLVIKGHPARNSAGAPQIKAGGDPGDLIPGAVTPDLCAWTAPLGFGGRRGRPKKVQSSRGAVWDSGVPAQPRARIWLSAPRSASAGRAGSEGVRQATKPSGRTSTAPAAPMP